MKTTDWFTDLFNTPYYHTLYKHRNDEDAQFFMQNIISYLKLPKTAHILDLPCGKGRHSIYLNKLGYNVTGVDLSKNSIEYASQFKNKTLQFKVHDMSLPYSEKFAAVFNLFTSFGYFENEENNLKTIKAIKSNLSDDGFGIIDFMNVEYVINNLVATEIKEVSGIQFHIKRYVEDGYIYKEIKFNDKGKDFLFEEKVKALALQDFLHYFENAQVDLLSIFGDYQLKKFHKTDSPRLILIFK